jgi:hypothetical protein
MQGLIEGLAEALSMVFPDSSTGWRGWVLWLSLVAILVLGVVLLAHG